MAEHQDVALPTIDIVTIFPKQVEAFLAEGIFRIARKQGIAINVHDLRKWTTDKHKTVDDHPFGGGPGMVMKVEPFYQAVSELKKKNTTVILTSPRGKPFNQHVAKELAHRNHLILLCGHYEGVDERVREHLADMDISIGEYVLSGGELPALVVSDAVLRQIPGVLGNPDSLTEESFETDTPLEYPQYTRPEVFRRWRVPDVLMSGDHKKVAQWRKQKVSM